MAQRLSGEPTNTKFDTSRPEKEVTTTTIGDKTYLDVNSKLQVSDIDIGDVNLLNIAKDQINPATEDKQDDIISVLSNTYDVLIASDSSDSNITYIGKAAKGSLTSAEVWQIKIIDKTTGVSIKFKGDVDTFTHEWDERES
jgi:hypothetical protein